MNHMFVTGSAKAGNGFQAAQNLRAGDSKEQEAERLCSRGGRVPIPRGVVKGENQNNAGVKCSVTMFWVDIGPVQHNSNWAVLVEQQGEGPIPKVTNKR